MAKMVVETECPGLELLEVAFELFRITLPTPDKVAKGESRSNHTKVGPTGETLALYQMPFQVINYPAQVNSY